jgi:hypothetical protein
LRRRFRAPAPSPGPSGDDDPFSSESFSIGAYAPVFALFRIHHQGCVGRRKVDILPPLSSLVDTLPSSYSGGSFTAVVV